MWCSLCLLLAVQLLGTGTAASRKTNADFLQRANFNENQAHMKRALRDLEGSAIGAIEANEESCQLEPDAGPCFGLSDRFFYNQTSMACEQFKFGGCLGNKNNFIKERDCLQTCRTEAACRLPIETGSCRKSIDFWAFDSNIGRCIRFTYSGCEGNGNKFYTKKECVEYCDPIPEGEDELLAVKAKA
ncbi:protein AMBP isoform X1 [Hemitrygon akajei]|uniref:protein AMBP isoform X1 n=1 Tax=Hemitrygon akajei TaxID=2704970 RepID=UPI003BF9A58D